jgi:phosphate transport system permease protein
VTTREGVQTPSDVLGPASTARGTATIEPTVERPAAPARSSTGTGAGGPPSPGVPRPRRLPNPIRPTDFGVTDVGLLVAAAVSAFALVWVVFYQLTLLSGAFGFFLCWYLVFVVLTWFGTAQVIERQVATDRVVAVVVVSAGLLMVGLVLFIILWVAVKAIPTIHWGSIFTKDQQDLQVSNPDVLNHVGISEAIVGTLEQVGIAALIGVPLAIATAVFLNEVGGRGVKLVRTVVTAMSGTPAVVAGIFIYSIFILTHILSYSGFAAALALVVIMLPWVTRVVEEVLRVVPGGLREASQALGAPQWRTVWSVVLPTSRSGVVTAVLLGVARIVGETAPLLFTAFGSQVMNYNPLEHDQGALPLTIWSDFKAPQAVYTDLAFQAAFVLMSIVLILFVLARFFSRTKGKKGHRGGQGQDDFMARMFVPVPMDRPDSMTSIDGEVNQ